MTLTNLLLIGDLSTPQNFTFFLGAMAMMAASAFFFLSLPQFDNKWRTSILVSGLITFIAAVHYYYMKESALNGGDVITEVRYIDWILTVPLMCVEFYLILKVAGATKKHLNILIFASLVMLLTGYMGEKSGTDTNSPAAWGFVSGIAYFYIVYLIKYGALAKLAASAGGAVEKAHKTLTWFVIVGWAIYPLGYMIGTEGQWYSGLSGIFENPDEAMNVVYNIGDAINKIGFGLVVYAAAVASKK